MLLNGKKGLIMGVASDRSLAWGIAQKAAEQGAELAFSYQSEVFFKRLEPLIEKINVKHVIECDVASEESMQNLFKEVEHRFGKLDFLVHSIAYSGKDELKGKYLDTTRENFLSTMDISCFSLTSACKYASAIMSSGGSILTLSYIGATRVMPHYNVMGVAKAALEASVRYLAVDLGSMGIRINTISAGPAKTLAAAGIGDFRYMLKWNQLNSPLKRNINLDDLGNTALFLLSDLSSAVTGDTIFVDSGYHVVGMKAIDAPDIALV